MNYEDFKARLTEEFSKNNINLNNKIIAIIIIILVIISSFFAVFQ